MSKKEVQECKCIYCDSEFKIVYIQEEVNGLHKFCSFCGSELELEEEFNEEIDD
jgi:hypothetical protein